MSSDNNCQIVGNLTADPELRFTPSGAAVANFTIVSTPRVKKGDTWEDGDPLFMRCTVWRQVAENVAESFTKGARVMAVGRLKQRSYDTREGEKRTVVEMDVDEIAASVKFATVKINRTSRGASASAPADDPWAGAPMATDRGDTRFGDDEPPF
jgi:single-strand DNA-binding protein